ncbi:hypothetical protein E4T56_gene2467 [Termitomyces sp. T112]|nr:hypothetical protein E4T56_gene2467 [Termitomyces sp. T112]KAH0589674.1 hypothetical protein H2248_005398 [Termitomyces sp. 'cryptogamus']KNZ76587.1 hypothetical protein J132_09448 [Termitomyces sp. J132]
MTRSVLSPRGPEVAKKQFRANAKAAGLTFRAAAEARNLLPKPKPSIAPGMGRRTHGKMNETYWNGRAFVHVGDDAEDHILCPSSADCKLCNFEFEPPRKMGADGLGQESQDLVLASLLDIAKPAKRKGVTKNFEVVDSVTRVIALEHDVWQDDVGRSLDNDELWEEWDEAYREYDMLDDVWQEDVSRRLDDDDLWEDLGKAYREYDTIDKIKPLYSAILDGRAQVG